MDTKDRMRARNAALRLHHPGYRDNPANRKHRDLELAQSH